MKKFGLFKGLKRESSFLPGPELVVQIRGGGRTTELQVSILVKHSGGMLKSPGLLARVVNRQLL